MSALWEKIPIWGKALLVIGMIWLAGWSSAITAQEWQDIPGILDDHEERITTLEQQRSAATDRNNRNFIYVACRLDELATASNGARCDLILDQPTRELLQQLRTP